MTIENEEFSATGQNLILKGWTELMSWKQIANKEVPSVKKGDILNVHSVSLCKRVKLDFVLHNSTRCLISRNMLKIKVLEKQTSPPDYLTEVGKKLESFEKVNSIFVLFVF